MEIMAQFLADWLPFLSQGMCDTCSTVISRRIESLRSGPSITSKQIEATMAHLDLESSCTSNCIMPTVGDPVPESSTMISRTPSSDDLDQQPCNQINHIDPSGFSAILVKSPCWQIDQACSQTNHIILSGGNLVPELSTLTIPVNNLNSELAKESTIACSLRDDMALEEDELEGMEDKKKLSRKEKEKGQKLDEEKMELSREEQKELERFRNVKSNKEFECLERVKGKTVNILQGLELYSGIFSPFEQNQIVNCVYDLLDQGRKGKLGERTYSAPVKWMRGKGRITMQFGCNYNYATDRDGNPPGIMRNVAADPMPDLFKTMIKRLLKWHVLPMTCIPDSCIVNVYEPGDCMPPHIDSNEFLRPFCTLSFLSECNILFGANLKVRGPGDFDGSFSIPLPVGSVLVLNGNGADVAKHCVPAVPTKRISITFRKMKTSKWPAGFVPERDLQDVVPLPRAPNSNEPPDMTPPRERRKYDDNGVTSHMSPSRKPPRYSRRALHQSPPRQNTHDLARPADLWPLRRRGRHDLVETVTLSQSKRRRHDFDDLSPIRRNRERPSERRERVEDHHSPPSKRRRGY